jgi:fumarate hydratase class I
MLAEFGSPEAVWELEIQDFPAIVTMDSTGLSLHAQVENTSKHCLMVSLA